MGRDRIWVVIEYGSDPTPRCSAAHSAAVAAAGPTRSARIPPDPAFSRRIQAVPSQGVGDPAGSGEIRRDPIEYGSDPTPRCSALHSAAVAAAGPIKLLTSAEE